MKTTFTVSRVLLGLIFLASGISGFLLISNPPPMPPGLAGEFQTVFFRSGWVLFVDGVELIAGLGLLTNRFVPLALVSLAAVIANILTFHITMMPAGLPVALFVTLLWVTASWPYRTIFAPMLARRVDLTEISHAHLELSHSRS
jgi:putative oxidoreductase